MNDNVDSIEHLDIEADAELLAKFVECNDRAAIERLIVRYAPMVASICRVTTHNRSDAEDAFQATFLVLLQSARSVRKQNSIAAWLHGVAFRISCRARICRQKQEATVSTDSDLTASAQCSRDDQSDPVVLVTRKMELEKLVRELERLPTNLRSTLVEHYLLGFTTQEIAARMEISQSAVDGRLRRGRRALRERLVRQGISLSIALAAVSLLQRQLNAAEGSVWCQQFLNHQLNNHCLGLSCNSNSQANALARGELSMKMKLAALKTSIGVAMFGAIGSVAALGYFSDEGGGSPGTQLAHQSTEVVSMISAEETTKERAEQVVLAQPVQESAVETSKGVAKKPSSASPVLSQFGPLPGAQPNSAQLNSAQPNGVNGVQPNSATAQVVKKEPEKIVNWELPEAPKPAWLAGFETESEAQEQIETNRQSLRKRLKEGVSFQDVPLKDVVRHLSEDVGVSFHIDAPRLEEEGIQYDVPITITLPPCSLRETLDMALAPVGLSYQVRESCIEITTQAHVNDSEGTLRCYDLSYIFPSSEHANKLIQTIEMSIDSDGWQNMGGSSTISMIGSVMVVSCPETTHFKLENLLRTIAKMNPSNKTPNEPTYLGPMGGMSGGGMGGGGMGGGTGAMGGGMF